MDLDRRRPLPLTLPYQNILKAEYPDYILTVTPEAVPGSIKNRYNFSASCPKKIKFETFASRILVFYVNGFENETYKPYIEIIICMKHYKKYCISNINTGRIRKRLATFNSKDDTICGFP
ncbi:hypothetical protein J6590_089779 [Homalodisca vitripennis]|nr:hypothetical protein J6590_080980 [Homalodisca vitripennis]KAG8280094.1 hypothetical protein J6590_089779 [Homalodisca vitripennis]